MGVEIDSLVELEAGLLEIIIDLAGLPSCDLLVVAGVPDLDKKEGICVPRSLLAEAKVQVFKERRGRTWNVGIALSSKACGLLESSRAYFVYLLAHELGHAHVALTDPDLHVYGCFIDSNFWEASGGVMMDWHELPHERAHDRFGITVAEELLGRDRVEADFNRLLTDKSREDRKRLTATLGLPRGRDYSALRHEMAAFALPYAAALEKIWTRHSESAAAAKNTSLTDHAPHISQLFKGTEFEFSALNSREHR